MELYNKRTIGSQQEKVAATYLSRKHYMIRELNFRCCFGEIDLIATDGLTLVFCEVKYRNHSDINVALEAVNRKKQKVLYRCAQFYLQKFRMETIPCRFDVIGMTDQDIIHIEDAF